MGAFDDDFREMAIEMLDDVKSITYVQTIVQEGAYNTETSEADPDTIIVNTYHIKALFSSVSSGDITTGLATATDIKITVAALDIENPMNGDIIDNKYPVTYVKPHYSGDLIAYFELICKAR